MVASENVGEEPTQREAPARAPFPDWWWEQTVGTRRWIAAGVVLLAVVLAVGAFSWLRDGEPNPTLYVAGLSPARVAAWDALAECESEGQWDLNSGNGHYGGIQFTQQSWEAVGGKGSPAEASREEQIMRGEFLFEEQGRSAWPNCASQAGL